MTGWIGGVRFGRPGAPAVAAWLLTLISVAVLSAVPLRLAEGAMSVIEDRLDAAPIAETHLEVTTIVDLSKRSIEAPFAPDAAAPPFDVPSMFQHPTVTSSWLDLPRFVARQRNGEPLPFRLRLTLRVVDGFDQVARTIRVADAVAPSDSSAEIVDIAVTEATAHLMRVDLGDVLELTTDPDDPVARAYQGSVLATKVRVAALVELSPPEDPIWFGDDSLHEARQRDTNDGFEVDAAAAVALDDFFLTPSLRPVGGNGTLRQLRSMDAPAPTVSGADEWSLELARMASATPATPPIGTPSGSSRLAALLDDVARSRGQANRTVSATRALLAVLAVVAVVRLITHAVDDQRAALAVWRARGASRRRLTAGATAAGIAASVVAAALGVVVAVVVVGGAATFTRSTIVWPLLAGVGVGSLVGMVVRTVTSRPLGPELRRETVDGGAIQRGVDIVVSVVAVASIIVIVRAGERTETSIRVATIALSALVLTGGIVARRSVIFVARRRRGRSLSTDLAVRQLASGGSAAPLLADVTVVGIAALALSSALLAADRSVLVDRSWAVAVAPVRAAALPGGEIDLDSVRALTGAAIVAGEAQLSGPLSVDGADPLLTTVLSVDLDAAAVLSETDPAKPFGDQALGSLDDAGRIPVLVPPEGIGTGPIPAGAMLRGVATLDDLSMVVVGYHHARQADRPMVVADRSLVESALGRPLRVEAVSLPATVDVTDLAAVGGIASVTERSAIESVLTNDALRRSLVGGVQLVMTAASAITVAGVGFTALLVVHARRRQSALLAALGADRRTIDRTVFAELLVSLVAAVAVGLATSGVVLRLIGPAIVPDEVAGGRLSPTPSAVAAAVALLALGGAVAFTIRRIVPNRTSRTLRLEVT